MPTHDLIRRIQELSRLKKTQGLTNDEAVEQARLREQYLLEIQVLVKQGPERKCTQNSAEGLSEPSNILNIKTI